MTAYEKVKLGHECCKVSCGDDPFAKCGECTYNDVSVSVQDCRAILSEETLKLLDGYDRALILLKAAQELIPKILEGDCYATAYYDDAECDGFCLASDIEAWLEYRV